MIERQQRALEPELGMALYAHLADDRLRGYSLGELAAELKVGVARAHLHLSRLVDAGLVKTAWRGTTVTYSFNELPHTK